MHRPLAVWISFLALLAGSFAWYGGVSEAGLPSTAVAFSALYLISLVVLKEPARLSRGTLVFLLAFAGLFLIQLLPTGPILFPYTAKLRQTHGVGQLWPGTADTFYTLRTLAQAITYLMCGLLVLRLRQSGLSSSQALSGLLLLLLAEACYGIVQVFAELKDIPFFGSRPSLDSASGSLVSRNNFGGLMAVGLVLAMVRAYGRFAWPPRGGADPGRPRWMKRIESGIGWAFAAAIFTVALVLSKSRGATLSAFGGIALLPFFYRGRASAAGAVALLALASLAVFIANPAGLLQRFGTTDPFDISTEARWTIFATTAQAALRQPWFGFGWGTHPRAYHPFQPASLPGQIHHAHSEYVNILFEAGFVGLGICLAAFGYWLVRAWKAQRPISGPDRIQLTGALAATLVIAIHSFVDFDLRITSIGIVWSALIAIAAAAVRDGESRTTWPMPIFSILVAGVLLVVPLNPHSPTGEQEARRFLGLSPYDYESAWALAHETGESTRLDIAADLWPAHPDIQREAGLLFWAREDRSRASKCLRRVFEQEPLSVENVMAELWRKGSKPSDFEALLPDLAPAHAVYAAFLVGRGLWQEGSEEFERHVPTTAENTIWFDYFANKLQAVGQWGVEATIRDQRLSVRSDPWAYAAAAQAWLQLGAYDLALTRVQTSARIDPTNARWLGLKGTILASKGDRVAAVEAFTQASVLAPAELEWLVQRGLVELSDKTYRSAAGDFQDVLRSHPEDRRAAMGLIQALSGDGQTSSAMIQIDDWLRKHPGDEEMRSLRTSLPR